MNKFILLVLVVAAWQARRIAPNHLIIDDVKSYFTNNMLSQASGGFLGSNKTLFETLGSKYLGLGQNTAPQNGLESITNMFQSNPQNAAAGAPAGGFNFQQIVSKYLGGANQPGAAQVAPPAAPGFAATGPTPNNFVPGNFQTPAPTTPTTPVTQDNNPLSVKNIMGLFTNQNNAAGGNGVPNSGDNGIVSMASKWLGNQFNPGAGASAVPAAPTGNPNTLSNALSSVSNIFSGGKQGVSGLLGNLYHD